jgi:hypothetical protein
VCCILCLWHFCFSSDTDEDVPVASAVETGPEGSKLGSENGSADDTGGKGLLFCVRKVKTNATSVLQ